MKKLLSVALLLALALLIFSACGTADQPATTTPEAPATTTPAAQGEAAPPSTAQEAVNLQLLWFSDADEGESMMRLAALYSEENPHVSFELIEVPFSEFENRLRNMIIGNMPPALARINNIGVFQNQLVDLSQHLGSGFADNFNDGLRFVFDGQILAAPLNVTANGLVYNRTAFEAAGISVPSSVDDIWTWEEWHAAMTQVVAETDVTYGLVFDRSPHRFTTLMYQAGGSMLTPDLTASNFNTPENYRAVSFFKQLHDEGLIPAAVWLGTENPNNMFRTGQIAMHFAGSWMLANYAAEITDFEWGFTYLPRDARRSSVPGGNYIAAFEGSGVEAEAARFIEWLSRPENNAVYMLENNFISQVRGNESLDYDFGADYFSIFASDLAASGPQPGLEWGFMEFTSRIQVDMRESLAEVLAGMLSVEDYLIMLDEMATRILAELD